MSIRQEIEIGRHAPISLQGDHSSQMPWNASLSRHGSVQRLRSGRTGGISPSVGGTGAGVEFGQLSALTGRRGSRLISASPLFGRGGTRPRYSSLELPEQPKLARGDAGEWSAAMDDHATRPGDNSEQGHDFQLYSPAAAVDTQTAAQSQGVMSALDAEAQNFLAFLRMEVNAEIIAAKQAGVMVGDDDMGKVTFEGLLPPEQHSKTVAAQGLLHVLSLATKGLVTLRQQEAFESIAIWIVDGQEESEDDRQAIDI